MKRSKFTLIIFLFLAARPFFAQCICQCSVFKTQGAIQRLCENDPEEEKGAVCKNWRYVLADKSRAQCMKMERKFFPCSGYRKSTSFPMRWKYSSDGQYHSCQYY